MIYLSYRMPKDYQVCKPLNQKLMIVFSLLKIIWSKIFNQVKLNKCRLINYQLINYSLKIFMMAMKVFNKKHFTINQMSYLIKNNILKNKFKIIILKWALNKKRKRNNMILDLNKLLKIKDIIVNYQINHLVQVLCPCLKNYFYNSLIKWNQIQIYNWVSLNRKASCRKKKIKMNKQIK